MYEDALYMLKNQKCHVGIANFRAFSLYSPKK